VSIGTNDLIQYTLAIDRADEAVAHLYDPLHPAVLRLVAETIAECNARASGVSVCGEMAGDPPYTACCWAWACAVSPCTRRRS
jgi:phosphotransferase system enzyme I (PtsI)